jgi:hypothetical protein
MRRCSAIAAARDYRWQPCRPCIDAGTNAAPGLPPGDFEDRVRVIDRDTDVTATADMGMLGYIPKIEDFPWGALLSWIHKKEMT